MRRLGSIRIALLLVAVAAPLSAGPAASQAAFNRPPEPGAARVFVPSGEPASLPPAAAPSQAAKTRPAKARPKAAPVTHERVVLRSDPRPSYNPGSIEAIGRAVERYRGIMRAGGWPILPERLTLAAGATGPLVEVLRRRLVLEGDLAGEFAEGDRFDAELREGLIRFQKRHGLTANGRVEGPTLVGLRAPVEARLKQLEASAARLAMRNFAFGPRHVVVNIPSAAVEAIEEGRVVQRRVAVVGKSDRPSPEVTTRITSVNLNPTWTVPVSIVKKDILPKMRKDPSYLAKAKIRVLGASGKEIDPTAIDWSTERALAFTLRQDAGAGNALGQLRIDMPNREAVYLHDTPSKRLFARDDRFHSSGCVRVEGVRDLAAWLLAPQAGLDRAAIDAGIASGERKDIRLAQPVPVAWVYLTGYVTEDGLVHFRPDVYGLDDQPAPVPAAPAPPVARLDPSPLDRLLVDPGPRQRLDP